MTMKSALSAIALATALVAGPAIAQTAAMPTMIGTQTVSETDAGAVKAHCDQLKLASETQSLTSTTDSEADDSAEDNTAGNAGIVNEPETDGATALAVNLDIVTLEECEADGWFAEM